MPNTRPGSTLLFHFAGIDVFLHWSWFVVALFELRARGRFYPSFAWNIAEYLILFAVVLLHEFGHALACRQVGGTANQIVLWPLGGVAYVEPPPRPGATLWSIAAGPLVNVLLASIFFALGTWGSHAGWRFAAPHAYYLLWAVFWMNAGLLILNLLPIYPLDGGQILRSLLWFLVGPARSLKAVSVLGLLGALVFIAGGVWSHSVWIGIIAVYMVMNCWTGLQRAKILSHSEAPPRSEGTFKEEYIETSDPSVRSRVSARHRSKITSLQALGFQQFACRLEVLPPYSAISKFPMIPLMWSKEVLVFPKPARLAVANLLMSHSSPSCIAEVLGFGIKFYSLFSDGMLLISASYRYPFNPIPNSQIIKTRECHSVEEAWAAHKQKLQELEAEGRTIRYLTCFADYVQIEAKRQAGMVVAI
jgi:Zn-dependent protease